MSGGPSGVWLIPLHGIGEVSQGEDVASLILEAVKGNELELAAGDVVVVTHKIVSKAEGRIAAIPDEASYRALSAAEATAVIRRRGEMIIAVTPHGFICANAGVDRSNVADGHAAMLPVDPDASAHRIRIRLERAAGVPLAVVVTDTFGRPWRRGLVDVAIGVSGIDPILDLRGTTDTAGRVLDVTEVAIVDEIAAAADLVMGKASGLPVAIMRGLQWEPGEGRATDLVRPVGEDMFR